TAATEDGSKLLPTTFDTTSQSVTIPTGFSFSVIITLPIVCSFIFIAMSAMLSLGIAVITGLFIISLTSTLVVMFASVCSTSFFATIYFRIFWFNYLSNLHLYNLI